MISFSIGLLYYYIFFRTTFLYTYIFLMLTWFCIFLYIFIILILFWYLFFKLFYLSHFIFHFIFKCSPFSLLFAFLEVSTLLISLKFLLMFIINITFHIFSTTSITIIFFANFFLYFMFQCKCLFTWLISVYFL